MDALHRFRAAIGPQTAWLVCLVGLSSALGACDDDDSVRDAGGEPGPALRCRDDAIERRQDGGWVIEQACGDTGAVCSVDDAGVPACVVPPCLAGEKNCDEDVLLRCVDGEWEVEQDCAANGLRCMPLLGGLPLCAPATE